MYQSCLLNEIERWKMSNVMAVSFKVLNTQWYDLNRRKHLWFSCKKFHNLLIKNLRCVACPKRTWLVTLCPYCREKVYSILCLYIPICQYALFVARSEQIVLASNKNCIIPCTRWIAFIFDHSAECMISNSEAKRKTCRFCRYENS